MTRSSSRFGATIVLPLLLVTAAPAEPPPRAGTAAGGNAQDLLLTVSLAPGKATLVDLEVASRRPGTNRTGDGWDAQPLLAGHAFEGRSLVLTLYDQKRERLGSWVAPATGMMFHDEVTDDKTRALSGGVSNPLTYEGQVRVPFPPDAAWLTLAIVSAVPPAKDVLGPCDDASCFRCAAAGPGAPVPEAFAAYPLVRAFEATDLAMGETSLSFAPALGLPEIFVRSRCLKIPIPVLNRLFPFPCPCSIGCPMGRLRLHGSLDAGDAFDVVILGDGFVRDEQGKLLQWAQRYTRALLATEPFKSRETSINVWLVLTASAQSGVTNCPVDGPRSTYFQVEGRWPNVDGTASGPAHFGTGTMCMVRREVANVAPLSEIEAVVMLANCGERGGNADPANRIAYLSLHDDAEESFDWFALHESAHAMAWLGDEYAGCSPADPSHPYPVYRPNVVPEAEKENAWWKALADPQTELTGGNFRWIHKCGAPFSTGCLPKLSGVQVGPSALGVFWGAMYGDSTRAANSPACDTCTRRNPLNGACECRASCDAYRPVPEDCKMRHLDRTFCPACEEVLCQAIRRAAPGAAPCRLSSFPP